MWPFNKNKKPTPNDKATPKPKKLSPKEQATANHEPYVTIVSIDIDPNDPGSGSFELDFNDVFVAKLVRAGYRGKTDADIVDQWFHTICLNVINDTFEQDMADPEKREEFNRRRDLGGGRSEFS